MNKIYSFCLVFLILSPSVYGQSIEDIISTYRHVGTRVPQDVYVQGLCPDCDTYGLQEFSLGDGTDAFDKSSRRDFRIVVHANLIKLLNPTTDVIEKKAGIYYIMFTNWDLYDKTLKDIEARYLKKYNTYVSKSPFALSGNLFDIAISKFIWYNKQPRISRMGFKVTVVYHP